MTKPPMTDPPLTDPPPTTGPPPVTAGHEEQVTAR